jgi:hypothetical protein
LYYRDLGLPIHDYLVTRGKGYAAFAKMGANFKHEHQFVKNCHERIDALRTLQCLRFYHREPQHAPGNLRRLLTALAGQVDLDPECPDFDVQTDKVADLDHLRHRLFALGNKLQQHFMVQWDCAANW